MVNFQNTTAISFCIWLPAADPPSPSSSASRSSTSTKLSEGPLYRAWGPAGFPLLLTSPNALFTSIKYNSWDNSKKVKIKNQMNFEIPLRGLSCHFC